MPACRNRRGRSAAVASILVVGVIGFGAFSAEAQQSGPVKLAPPTRLAPAPEAEPAPSAPVPSIVAPEYKAGPGGQAVTTLSSVGSGSIQVDRLQVVTPDSAGILTTENGGFGIDLWHGLSMPVALSMLAAVPDKLQSRVIADLVRRLALTPAQPPAGPSDGTQLALERLSVLMTIADYPAALDLLSVMPSQGRGPGLLRAEAELRLLSGDNVAACSLAGNEVRRNQGAFWQKALIFCQILSDQPDKAELGISMLREIGTEDASFFRLAEAMTTGAAADLGALDAPDALAQSMLRYVKIEATADQLGRLAPGAVRALALNESLAADLRLAAVEYAAGLGVFSDGAIRKLVVKIAAAAPVPGEAPKPATTEGNSENAPNGASSDIGPLARAKLFMTATGAGVATLKAEAAARALESAKADGVFTGTARLFREELAAIPVSSEHIWFATVAVRAALTNGDLEIAENWVTLLKRYQLLASADTKALTELAPLIRVMGVGKEAAGWAPTEDAGDGALGVLPRAVLGALGERSDALKWLALTAEAGGAAPPQMPEPALWFALRALNAEKEAPAVSALDTPTVAGEGGNAVQAAGGGGVTVTQLVAPSTGARSDISNKAARILTIARVAGSAAVANPIVIHELIAGMKALGLDKEAKAFGLEALLEGGF
jgi:hypothetical protein